MGAFVTKLIAIFQQIRMAIKKLEEPSVVPERRGFILKANDGNQFLEF